MKSTRQCPKCDSLKVGYFEKIYEQGASRDHPVPASVGMIEGKGFLSRDEVSGELEAYLCAACGYYETYVKDPGSISFEDLKGFQWLNPDPSADGPFR